jgi:hypothetical protein
VVAEDVGTSEHILVGVVLAARALAVQAAVNAALEALAVPLAESERFQAAKIG